MTTRERVVDVLSRARLRRLSRSVVERRAAKVLEALDVKYGEQSERSALSVLVDRLSTADVEIIWLTLAVISGRLPRPSEVTHARRSLVIDGAGAIIAQARRMATSASANRDVDIVRGETIIDIGELVNSPLGTGIQRVARNVVMEWRSAHPDVVVVGWTRALDAMRTVGEAELSAALSFAGAAAERLHRASETATVVPWECTYLLPELVVDERRCARLQAMAESTSTRTTVIGFDCVPITSQETSAPGFAGHFALNLAAVARFTTVVAISEAAATEYRGWARMLSAPGIAGPDVVPVMLPTAAPEPTADALRRAAERLTIPGVPFVLCVGSHEPRKNHLAVLEAAELLWQEGLTFSLAFIGGHSWRSEEFFDRIEELQADGRAIESVSQLDDEMLWAAYRLAKLTVFPSVNEGFGLPVAESLAAGTPAVTSAFGSMKEIAVGGGALLVDPHDDLSVADGMRRLLTDDRLHAQLVAQAGRRSPRTWAEYAAQVWASAHSSS